MLYMVECDFADPAQEDAWNHWYSGEKLDELLANPGFVATQRFKAVTPRKSAYLAIHSVKSADVFTTPTYKAGGGGRFGDWDPALVTNWSRRLFDGIAESPDVRKDEMLLVIDDGATPPPGIAVTWLEGLDWSAVVNTVTRSRSMRRWRAAASPSSPKRTRPSCRKVRAFTSMRR